MPLALHQYLPHNTALGIWHITETESELVEKLQLNAAEKAWLATLTHNKRYLHWLGSRVLIRWMLQTDEFIQLSADAYKKPILVNFPHEVSISHSHDMAAVIISEQKEVGIDLELIHEKVWRVKDRFLSPEELLQLPLQNHNSGTLLLIQYWCAKEALFKLYARGQLDFRKDLQIVPGPSEGLLLGYIHKPNMHNPYIIHTHQIENYMLAYVIGDAPATA